ncbi:bacterial proteasome activator family protein [soil metagenome]
MDSDPTESPSGDPTGDPTRDPTGDAPRDRTGDAPRDQTDPANPPNLVMIDPSDVPRPGPDGDGNDGAGDDDDRPITDLVEQPAKVMRLGSMIKQLLDEVRAAPLDERSRARLLDIHQSTVKELESGLAPELVDELERLSLPFAADAVPSESELRIAQAQLVGWLEGLFHGIQTVLFAQQMAAKAQFEEIRRRALMPGRGDTDQPQPSQPGQSGPYL